MSTPAQIAANSANALLSTGPRTFPGKERAAQNARSHGLTARDLVVAEHEREEFEELQSSLTDQLAPSGALQITVFHQLLHAAWNLARIRRLEAELWQIEPNLLLDDAASKSFDRLSKYQVRTERSYYRALKELRILQAGCAAVTSTSSPTDCAKRTQSRTTLVAPAPPEVPVLPHLDSAILRV